MEPFLRHRGIVAPIPQVNVDTDQMVPKQFLKLQTRRGYGRVLFYDWRYLAGEVPNGDFVLNLPRYKGASVLLARANFGCGSSREHAPWALLDFGVRCVIAPSFADIFYNNCFENGLLPVALPEDQVKAIMDEAKGGNHLFTVDLETQSVVSPSGARFGFEIDPGRKEKLLKGLDAVGETLQHAGDIGVFEHKRALAQPWLERRA